MLFFAAAIILIVLFLFFEYSVFVPGKKGLLVLMYHKVTAEQKPDRITVTANQFRQHLQYLQRRGYNSISLRQLITNDAQLPKKPLLLTFDDGYKDNLINMYPILKEFDMSCCIFLVPDFLNKAKYSNEFLCAEDIQKIDKSIVEFGLHGFDHTSYKNLSNEAIEDDLIKTKNAFEKMKISFFPAFAYPYGAYPKNDMLKQQKIFSIFEKQNIKVAFKIGNRINRLPLENRYLINRTDIRGTDSFFRFKQKVKKGRSKLL